MTNHRRKFAPTYKGLYVVKKAFSREALILADMDGNDFCPPILILSYNTLHEGAFKCNLFFPTFLCKRKTKTRKKRKKKEKKKKKKKQKKKKKKKKKGKL